jgi:L-seryl-tRNA(Ser) seleniumtransferase
MLTQSPAVLRARAARLRKALAELPNLSAEIAASTAFAGGGSLPGEAIESAAVTLLLEGSDASLLADRLRRGNPAIVGRVSDGRLHLDMFAVNDNDLTSVAGAVRLAATEAG